MTGDHAKDGLKIESGTNVVTCFSCIINNSMKNGIVNRYCHTKYHIAINVSYGRVEVVKLHLYLSLMLEKSLHNLHAGLYKS